MKIVIVEDNDGKEVLRRKQWISTGVMTGLTAKEGVKRVVERMTMDMWAHLEGTKEAMTYKTEVEKYRATCDHFVETKDRPTPQGGSTGIVE